MKRVGVTTVVLLSLIFASLSTVEAFLCTDCTGVARAREDRTLKTGPRLSV